MIVISSINYWKKKRHQEFLLTEKKNYSQLTTVS